MRTLTTRLCSAPTGAGTAATRVGAAPTRAEAAPAGVGAVHNSGETFAAHPGTPLHAPRPDQITGGRPARRRATPRRGAIA